MSDQPAASDSAASTNLQTALNAEVAFGLRPTVTGLGFLYLLFSIAHALVLPSPIKLPMVIVALSSVIFFWILVVALAKLAASPRADPSAGHALYCGWRLQ